MTRALIFVLLTGFALPAFAQDLRQFTERYLEEMLHASAAQAQLQDDETAAEYLALINDDSRWMNPKIKIGIGSALNHMAMLGAESAEVGQVQLAVDAARVPAMLRYRETPTFEWTVEVDFIRRREEWKLRAVRILERRALSTAAEPGAVLDSFVGDLLSSAERRNALDANSWTFEAVNRHWSFGGGYWRREADCQRAERAKCLSSQVSASNLWSAAILKRERTIVVEDTSLTGDVFAGKIVVTVPRRTTTSQSRYAVALEKDRRFGWQIVSLERLDKLAQPAAAELSIENSDSQTLVRSLVQALVGENAPTMAQLMASPDILDPYFSETREGRKAMARFMALSSMVNTLGGDPSQAVIEDLGDQKLRLTIPGSGATAISPVLIVEETPDGAKIAGIEE